MKLNFHITQLVSGGSKDFMLMRTLLPYHSHPLYIDVDTYYIICLNFSSGFLGVILIINDKYDQSISDLWLVGERGICEQEGHFVPL